MRVKETTRKEIEQKFMSMNDYVKIGYLESCLRNNLDFETRKFVLVKLSGLLEDKGMHLEAAKNMKAAADINTNVQSKVNDFIKSIELFVKAGDFEKAEAMMTRAISLAENQRIVVENSAKEIYRTHARACVEKNKRKQALDVYESYLDLNLSNEERKFAENKLLELYLSVGDMNKYNSLKRKIKI